MSSYRGTAERPDRAKAIAAVVAVHAMLALLILSGLKVHMAGSAVEELTTISIRQPAPPPPQAPPVRAKRATRPTQARKTAGEISTKAEPTEVVAPQRPHLPSPLAAARVAGAGQSPNAGAALSGAGTGEGSSGMGTGGGGSADYSRFTPARLVANIPNSEYRQLAATGIPSGLVGVLILVDPNGTASNCRIVRSSGDRAFDALVCQLTVTYVRFDPARDPYGRPVAQDVTYFPNWRRR